MIDPSNRNYRAYQHLADILLQESGGVLALFVTPLEIKKLTESKFLDVVGRINPELQDKNADELAHQLFNDRDQAVVDHAAIVISFLQLKPDEVLYFPDKDDKHMCWQGKVSSDVDLASKLRSPRNADWHSNKIHNAEKEITPDGNHTGSDYALQCGYRVQISGLKPVSDLAIGSWPEMELDFPASYPFVRAASVKQ